MAAKFKSAGDPFGEKALAHWISVGQLQEPLPSFSFLFEMSCWVVLIVFRLLCVCVVPLQSFYVCLYIC